MAHGVDLIRWPERNEYHSIAEDVSSSIHHSTGWPGSMHDARVYENSELGRTLPVKLAGTDYHLIADLAYPLSNYLLKSYSREAVSYG
ncbi:hypothetical protein DAPPUDRAFT_250963 [Daphnia pulex]|uniref:DDE Tnp4 domain-containing protein n=1 Tax=Daphnia pulex TaxID=6669 RepID=E9GZI4_DAPPU|nr:hypothetical protein DAPPUDRAFT_250963 [Daphnia pulex]|eukprot:EFX74996.1 hypothetical protein DAPPUDRAFT_250963 [Daphnia pulex]